MFKSNNSKIYQHQLYIIIFIVLFIVNCINIKAQYTITGNIFYTDNYAPVTGDKVSSSEFKKSGEYILKFDGSKYASGVYFYKIVSGYFSDVKKMVILK